MWTADALAFSGWPNLAWTMSEHDVGRLMQLWEPMNPSGKTTTNTTALGYRGCSLKGPEKREWVANRGMVTLKYPATSGIQDSRDDQERDFEKLLLLSAQAGVLSPRLEKSPRSRQPKMPTSAINCLIWKEQKATQIDSRSLYETFEPH
jgi:hypothetical protein